VELEPELAGVDDPELAGAAELELELEAELAASVVMVSATLTVVPVVISDICSLEGLLIATVRTTY